MVFSFFSAKSPSRQDIEEFNHYFHGDALRALVSSYNSQPYSYYGNIKGEFDFHNPTRFIHEDSGVNSSLFSSVHVKEIKGHGLTGCQLFQYETGINDSWVVSIVEVDTINKQARLFTLCGSHLYGYSISGDGWSFDVFFESEITDKNFFWRNIVDIVRIERRYSALTEPTSTAIHQILPLKIHSFAQKFNLHEQLKRVKPIDESNASHIAKTLKGYICNSRIGSASQLTYTYSEDSDLFFIRPIKNCILFFCRKGFENLETIKKIKWIFGLPMLKEESYMYSGTTFIFTDSITHKHDIINIDEIDLTQL